MADALGRCAAASRNSGAPPRGWDAAENAAAAEAVLERDCGRDRRRRRMSPTSENGGGGGGARAEMESARDASRTRNATSLNVPSPRSARCRRIVPGRRAWRSFVSSRTTRPRAVEDDEAQTGEAAAGRRIIRFSGDVRSLPAARDPRYHRDTLKSLVAEAERTRATHESSGRALSAETSSAEAARLRRHAEGIAAAAAAAAARETVARRARDATNVWRRFARRGSPTWSPRQGAIRLRGGVGVCGAPRGSRDGSRLARKRRRGGRRRGGGRSGGGGTPRAKSRPSCRGRRRARAAARRILARRWRRYRAGGVGVVRAGRATRRGERRGRSARRRETRGRRLRHSRHSELSLRGRARGTQRARGDVHGGAHGRSAHHGAQTRRRRRRRRGNGSVGAFVVGVKKKRTDDADDADDADDGLFDASSAAKPSAAAEKIRR